VSVKSQHRVQPTAVTERAHKRAWVAVTILTIVGLTVWHLSTVILFPSPHVDEGWFANRAMGYLTTGVPFGTMDMGVFDRYPQPWLIFPLVPTFLQALVIRVVGDVDLMALRVLSLVAGAALLYVVYRIASHVAGRWAGIPSVVFVGVSLPFAVASHYARHDMLAAAAGWGAIAIFFVSRKRWTDVAAGFLVMVGVEMHPNAAIFGLTLAVIALLDRSDRLKRFLAIGAGGLIGLIGFLALHVLPNPDSYSAVNRIAFVDTHVPPVLSGSVDVIIDSFTLKARLLASGFPVVAGASWLLAIVLIAVWVALLLSPKREDRRLAQMAALLGISFALLVRNTIYYYTILVAPVAPLLLGVGLVRLSGLRSGMNWKRITVVIAALGFVALGFPVFRIVTTSPNIFDRVSTEIASTLEPDDIVMGSQSYWIAAPEIDWRSWETLVYYRRVEPDASLLQAFRELGPDVLVVDSHIRRFVMDEDWSMGPYFQALGLPGDQFDDLVASGMLVATVEDGSDEGVQIFRFP
jgi:4-amino-4-deoxy-L-arabinose transferase-like glycosyltransferase